MKHLFIKVYIHLTYQTLFIYLSDTYYKYIHIQIYVKAFQYPVELMNNQKQISLDRKLHTHTLFFINFSIKLF